MSWNSKKHASTSHTFKAIETPDGEDSGLVLTGYTPDSNEWKKAAKAQAKGAPASSVIIDKKNERRIPIDKDAGEKQRALAAQMITGMTEDGKDVADIEDVRDQLLKNGDVAYILDQWIDHVNERENFFGKSAPVPKNTLAA